MQDALTNNHFKAQVYHRYKYSERVIGLVFARYTDAKVREIIDNSFTHWDKLSGAHVDLFWAGYGKYFYGCETETNLTVKHEDNLDKVFFDEESLLSFKREFPQFQELKKDRVSIVFIGYSNGKMREDAICFQFPKKVDPDVYKEIMNDLICLCIDHTNFDEFKWNLKLMECMSKLEGITIRDILGALGDIASIYGVLQSL